LPVFTSGAATKVVGGMVMAVAVVLMTAFAI
jgi:hypothetical protein